MSNPGNPTTKVDWRQGLEQFSEGYFEFDPESYWAQSQMIHGTTVVVAIHKSLVEVSDIRGFAAPIPQEFADFVFQVFHQYWHVFDGFVYDRYIVKVNAISDPQRFTGASAVGLILGSISGPDLNYPPHQYVSGMYEEFVSHEIFHAWNGGIIEYVPSNDRRLTQLETWITEGSTVYYSAWVRGIVKGFPAYANAMKGRWDQYARNVGTEYDLSLEGLTFKIGTPATLPPPPSEYTNMLYARSSMLNYMLDLELSGMGTNLDALMRYLYDNFGLKGKRWKQEDISAALQALSGRNFNDFFNAYLYTNAPLPLDGNFQFVNH